MIAAIISILALVVLHELGHFLFAKLFRVRVEEFGIGLPPRLFGRKAGETTYSLNLLPVGAFVKMTGEEGRSNDPASFGAKPIWQRMAIVAAGVAAFWVIAFFLFSVLGATSGIPTAIDDRIAVAQAQVEIVGVAPNSPAFRANLLPGDVLKNFTTVSGIQNFTKEANGKEIQLQIQRGKQAFIVSVTPRLNPPEGEGQLGLALSRVVFVRSAWYEAPVKGAKITAQLTGRILVGFFDLFKNLVIKHALPEGAQVSGPVGIVVMLSNVFSSGPASFFAFIGTLSVYLAIFNVLPIPAVDGGRLLFLAIEFFRKKPMAQYREQKIIAVSFAILLAFFMFVTIQDIIRLF